MLRIKTLSEMKAKFGNDWRNGPKTKWNDAGKMDYLLGKVLTPAQESRIKNYNDLGISDGGTHWHISLDATTSEPINTVPLEQVQELIAVYSYENVLDALLFIARRQA